MFRDIILMVLKQMNKTTSYSIGIIALEFTYASVSILSFTLKHESTLFFNIQFRFYCAKKLNFTSSFCFAGNRLTFVTDGVICIIDCLDSKGIQLFYKKKIKRKNY